MVVKGGRVPFLLLLASLMMASSASLASDFVTGLVVGQALSNSTGSSKNVDETQDSKEVINFSNGQEVVTKEVSFARNHWRKEEGPEGQSRYLICPEKAKAEYRNYGGPPRCRVADSGFNGLMGGMKDAQELPLTEALAAMEGRPIALQSIVIQDRSSLGPDTRRLMAKYQFVPVKQTPVKKVTGDSGQSTGLEQASSGQATTSAPVEAEKKPQGLNSMDVTSAPEVALQWLDSPAMKFLIIVFAIAGSWHGFSRGNVTSALLVIPLAFFPTIAKQLFLAGGLTETPLTETPATPGSGSWEATPIFLAGITAACVIAYFLYRRYVERARVMDERIDVLLRQSRAAAQSSAPVSRNNEPPTIDTLRERQQQSNTSEPVVVSSSAATPRDPRGEPEDVQPGKRKIILD